jgi:hypothetical protein
MMELAPKVKLPSWLEQRLSVIPLVYAQQKQMLETNTHACQNRIVSLAQPHPPICWYCVFWWK